jgi:hypothetical protein
VRTAAVAGAAHDDVIGVVAWVNEQTLRGGRNEYSNVEQSERRYACIGEES